jgi:hypothetical protein
VIDILTDLKDELDIALKVRLTMVRVEVKGERGLWIIVP